jgi:tRNA-dihydrouridine synthase
MITVHARTREQFYKGKARWHLVRPIVEAVRVPVVVNGDIVSLAAAREALRQSGAAAVMLGRGAQGRPWMPGQIGAGLKGLAAVAAPRGAVLSSLVAEHYEMILAEYGIAVGVRVARKHLDWYLDGQGIVLDKSLRASMLGSEDPAAVLALIGEVFADGWMVAA